MEVIPGYDEYSNRKATREAHHRVTIALRDTAAVSAISSEWTAGGKSRAQAIVHTSFSVDPAAMPAKRSRSQSAPGNDRGQAQQRSPHPIGDIFGYQELFLRILSFLSPTELALIQGVNHYWSRMSTDQQVSKAFRE